MKNLEDWSRDIAKHFWPELELTPKRSVEDRLGIDGYINKICVQIKCDRTMTQTGNIYHEIYEKNKGDNKQEWRHSPQMADLYIFCTDDYIVMTDVNSLAMAEDGKKLKAIRDTDFIKGEMCTSIGFLIKEHDLFWKDKRDIPVSLQLNMKPRAIRMF